MTMEYFDEFLQAHGDDLAFQTERMALAITTEIRKRMHELSITQEELAARMQVSPEYVSKLLNYNANLTLKSLAKIGIALSASWELPQLRSTARSGKSKPERRSKPAARKSRLTMQGFKSPRG